MTGLFNWCLFLLTLFSHTHTHTPLLNEPFLLYGSAGSSRACGQWRMANLPCSLCLQARDNTNYVLFCIPKAGVYLQLRVVHLSVPLSQTVGLIDRPSGDLIVLNYMSSCINVQFRLFLFALSWNLAIWITSWRLKRMTTCLSDSQCLLGNFAIRPREPACLPVCLLVSV